MNSRQRPPLQGDHGRRNNKEYRPARVRRKADTGRVIQNKKTGTVFRAGFCVFMYLHVKTPCAADLRLRTVKAVQISLTIHIDICCWNNSGSELRDVDSLRAFLTLDNIILHCFTLFERLESFLIDSAEVNEYIVTLGI